MSAGEGDEVELEDGDSISEDQLDAEFGALSEGERESLLEPYELDPEDWFDLSAEEKAAILGYEPARAREDDEPRYGDEFEDISLEVDPLLVEDGVTVVGEEGNEVTVAAIPLPGAHTVTFSGQGYESQYLREVEVGGGADADYGQTPPDGFEPDDGDDGEGGGEEDDGEEPPLRILIEAAIGQSAAESLVELREDEDSTFDVVIRDEIYPEMELHDFTRTLSGDSPYAYEAEIEVVEFREYEIEGVEDYTDRYDIGGGAGGDPEDEIRDWEGSGTPEEPRVISLDPGDDREFDIGPGERVRNTMFDTSEDGAGARLNTSGDDWEIHDVGWDAGGTVNRALIEGTGAGRIDTVFMGHGGEAGIIIEDTDSAEISRFNLQNSEIGVHAINGTAEEALNDPDAQTLDPPTGSGRSATRDDTQDGDSGDGGAGGGASPPGDGDYDTHIAIEYDDYSSPGQVYNVNDVRSSVAPSFETPEFDTATCLAHTFSGNQKTANTPYRFADHGHDPYPTEVSTRFQFHPNGMTIADQGTLRFCWAGLRDGPRSSGGDGAPDGSSGWSIALLISHREHHQHPDGYALGVYTYHMDMPGTSGENFYDSGVVAVDEWNEIETYQRLNTYSGGSANSDGVFQLWLNGSLAFSKEDFRWAAEDGQGIEQTGPMGYWYLSNQNGQTMYFADHEITMY